MQAFFNNFDKLVPPLLALLTLLSTFILTWLKDLSVVSRRMRILAEANQRQSFWKEWVGNLDACSASHSADRHLAEQELRRSARIVRQLYRYAPLPARWTPKTYKDYQQQLGFWRRSFVAYTMPTSRLVAYQRTFRLSVVMYLGSGILLSWLRYRNGSPITTSHPFWQGFDVSFQHHKMLYLDALAVCYLWFLVVMVVTRIRLEFLLSSWLEKGVRRPVKRLRAGLF